MAVTDQFIFFGTGGLLTSTCLKALIDANHTPLLVVMQKTESPFPNLTKMVCDREDIPVLYVDSVNNKEVQHKISVYNVSFGIVASFGEIFNKDLLSIFPIYNVHMGVLPFYRGAYTNFWKILNNDDVYGVTIHKMEEKVDSGEILLIKERDFEKVVFSGEFFKLNYEMAASTLNEAFEIMTGTVIADRIQVSEKGKYYRKHTSSDMELNPNESVKDLYKKINRLQFYGNPIINNLQLTSADLLLDEDLQISSYEIIQVSDRSSILKNQSGIVLLRHHTV